MRRRRENNKNEEEEEEEEEGKPIEMRRRKGRCREVGCRVDIGSMWGRCGGGKIEIKIK